MPSALPNRASALLAVFRFHARVGARLALRSAVPAFAAAFGAATLLGPDFLNSFAAVLYGPTAGPTHWLVPAAIALALAGMTAQRVCRGLTAGWLRHLPVAGTTHRRGAVLAGALAQIPLALALAVLAFTAAQRTGRVPWAALAGLPVLAFAAAVATVPARRRLASAPLAIAAAVAAASGRPGPLALAVILAVAADLVAGPIAAPRRARGRPIATARTAARSDLSFSARITWRALGGRLSGAYLVGLLPLGSGALFLANNELAPNHAALAARLAAGTAVVLMLASLAEELAVRRPAWPWARSLPWSARRRVLADALWLAAHAVPLLLIAAARAPLPALAAALPLPLLALRAAGAVRRAPERRTGASGEVLMEGLLAAAAVALLPWAGLLLLAGSPLALAAAAGRERRQKVSRWLELHHLAAGDPQSWSAE